mmetsp:Transcript_83074/g.178069  ORF Transcript_83074/g.178069 Transcript_83074/m.178069 type:complete len:209 (-) Transcript_83074:61-687(-)
MRWIRANDATRPALSIVQVLCVAPHTGITAAPGHVTIAQASRARQGSRRWFQCCRRRQRCCRPVLIGVVAAVTFVNYAVQRHCSRRRGNHCQERRRGNHCYELHRLVAVSALARCGAGQHQGSDEDAARKADPYDPREPRESASVGDPESSLRPLAIHKVMGRWLLEKTWIVFGLHVDAKLACELRACQVARFAFGEDGARLDRWRVH